MKMSYSVIEPGPVMHSTASECSARATAPEPFLSSRAAVFVTVAIAVATLLGVMV